MLGYNLLGYNAIMELERSHALVTVPSTVTVTFQPQLPLIQGGSGLFIPAPASLQWTPRIPSIRGGSYVLPPTPTWRIEPRVPQISISAKIYPGTPSTRWVPREPDIFAGKSVMSVSKSIEFITQVPFITAGKAVFAEPASTQWVPQAPKISISAKVYPVPATTRWAPQAPEIKAGNTIFVDSSRMLPYTLVGIGDMLLGAGSIFAGPVRYARSGDPIPILRLMTRTPKVVAGAQIKVPVSYINFSPKVVEITGRRRKLRTSVICS